MIDRRDLFIGAACLAGAGIAYELIPRRHVSLLGKARLDSLVPVAFGRWTSRDVSDLVAPKTEDSLAGRLYGQTVGRVYREGDDGAEVMMLLAHGDSQTDDLQLHRPEICYPAVGFALADDVAISLPLGPDVTIPSRRLTAHAADRFENIIYWSRLGEFFPTSGLQQHLARLKTSMRGAIADGVLARFSSLNPDAPAAFSALAAFIPALVAAIPAGQRDVLVGTSRAAALAGLR